MSHTKLYKDGKITFREYKELQGYELQIKNKRIIGVTRKQAKRIYKEKEKFYKQRARKLGI